MILKNFKGEKMMKRLLSYVVMAVAFVAFVGCGAGSSTPEAVAEKVMKNLLDGEVDAVIELMRTGDGKAFEGSDKTTLNGKITMSLAQYQDNGKAKSIKANEAQYNSDKTRANVDVVVEYDSGKKSTESFKVILVDGRWFVTI